MPDLRGLFLRGHGGQSAALGIKQGDAIRNITGAFNEGWTAQPIEISGVFKPAFNAGYLGWNGAGWCDMPRGFIFDASRVVPTAEENRPVNMSVRYLIRARP